MIANYDRIELIIWSYLLGSFGRCECHIDYCVVRRHWIQWTLYSKIVVYKFRKLQQTKRIVEGRFSKSANWVSWAVWNNNFKFVHILQICVDSNWKINPVHIVGLCQGDSHELQLMSAAVAGSSCIYAKIVNFLIFQSTTVCQSRMCQMHLVWMSFFLKNWAIPGLFVFIFFF